MKRIIATAGAPAAIGPYSQAVVSEGLAFVSGQIPLDPATGQMVEGGITAETTRVLENARAVLEACDSSLIDVLRTTVYLRDLGDFQAMNEVYAQYFPAVPPARTTVAVAGLPRDARISIDLIARVRR
jgi:2-iminobutanoate/2-iminopropanoate deaminase